MNNFRLLRPTTACKAPQLGKGNCPYALEKAVIETGHYNNALLLRFYPVRQFRFVFLTSITFTFLELWRVNGNDLLI
jgi:hypothetical protein